MSKPKASTIGKCTVSTIMLTPSLVNGVQIWSSYKVLVGFKTINFLFVAERTVFDS